MQCVSGSGHEPPQVGYGSPPEHGVKQKHKPTGEGEHSVPGWSQVPPQDGEVPSQNGGMQVPPPVG